MNDILVTSRSFGNVPSKAMQLIKDNDLSIVRPSQDGPFNDEEMAKLLSERQVSVVMVGSDEIDERVLMENPQLELISKHGVGVDNVNLEEAKRQGVVVTNTPQANKEAVAELAFGAIFTLNRRIVQADRSVRQSQWEKVIGNEVIGKTLGIVGLGKIGQRVAELALGIGMNVLYFDMEEKELEGASATNFDEILGRSDFVTLHCPLNQKTRNLIGEEEFAEMKSSSFLINTARGGVVDETALLSALSDGEIAGAYCDVFSEEPLPKDSPLRDIDEIVISPHMAAYTEEAIARMDEVSVRNIVNYLRGEDPVSRVV